MQAGLAIIVIMSVLEALARAQSGTEPVVTIPVHPDVTTTLHLPEAIVRVRFTVEIAGMIGAVTADDMVLIRPRAGLAVGEEVTVAIWTATLRWRLKLRRVEHARDAWKEVPVVAPHAEPVAGAPVIDTSKAAPAESAASASPGPPGPAVEPVESASPSLPGPAAPDAPEPVAAAERAVRTVRAGVAVSNDERDTGVAGSPRIDFSVHGVMTLAGTTALDIAGYEPTSARQPHRAFGVRMAAAPPGRWWAVEANLGGEWLAGPTVHGGAEPIVISGPWLRTDVGIRARFPIRWSPTAYAGTGLQAHHRDIESASRGVRLQQTLVLSGVLALGLGLAYRTGDLMLGVELHVRQGVPDTYRSTAVLLSAGCFLDQGE